MLIAASALFLLPFSQTAGSEFATYEQDKLATCIESTETDPELAYEESLAWLASGNRPNARYCNAMALIALEEYEEAAARLEALAAAPDAIEIDDRAQYMAQAGNAWLTANYPEAAIVALSEAVRLAPQRYDLYKDRAAANLALENWVAGVDDLNTVIANLPTDTEALQLRARAHLKTENLSAALADIEDAMRADTSNIDTLVLRGEIREAIRLSRELN